MDWSTLFLAATVFVICGLFVIPKATCFILWCHYSKKGDHKMAARAWDLGHEPITQLYIEAYNFEKSCKQ